MFGFGKNIFLGIDIGTSAIKMVELKLLSGKPTLTNYAWMPLSDSLVRDKANLTTFESTVPQYLKKMIREAKITAKDAYVSIPAFGGLITLIEFPEMAKEDMEQAIRYEAHKYIPTSLDEVVLSWDIIGKKDGPESIGFSKDTAKPSGSRSYNSSSKLQVLLVAASKSKVAKYEKVVKSSGLRLKSIELESFSMVNALVGNDPGRFIIVDIGSRICNIILVENGTIRVNRNIDAGGKDITGMIAKSMGVSEQRAEALKISDKNFFSQESSVSFPSLEMIFGEVSRIISSTREEDGNSKIDSIILSGGTANLTGIGEYFSDMLKQKVVVGNPFSRIQYEKKLEPIIKKRGIQFSVSIGLALKGVDNYLKDN
jgi:type IV pilus assembly protein PilM